MKRFTKLDSSLQPLPDDAKDFAAVLDHQQGITILAETSQGFDNDADVSAYIAKLNSEARLGCADWRQSARVETFLLTDDTRYDPACDPEFLPFIKANWYRTSTPDASDPDYAWFVFFRYGLADLYYRGYRGSVLAVRGGVPSPGQ